MDPPEGTGDDPRGLRMQRKMGGRGGEVEWVGASIYIGYLSLAQIILLPSPRHPLPEAFAGRIRELGLLSARLQSRTPTLTIVRGTPGIGVTRLVAEAVRGRPHIHLPVPVLPDAGTRELLASELARISSGQGVAEATEVGLPDWPALLTASTARAPAPAQERLPPFVLVLDDAHRLAAARSTVPRLLLGFMAGIQGRPLPFHLVLAGTDPWGMSRLLELPPGDPVPADILELEVPPLSPREVAPFLSRWSPIERLAAWSILGGNPRRLGALPPRAAMAAVLRDLVLDPEGALHGEVEETLERSFQAPARYAAVLQAVALGARSWGEISDAVPEPEGSARLGPYVRGLQERGLLEATASLDARPGSRDRRYDLPDPFVRFWFGVVLPRRAALRSLGVLRSWEEEVRPRLPEIVAALLPRAVRSWMERDAETVLGSTAREAGGLWGPDREIDVAGILRNGAAAYASCHWRDEPLREGDLERLDGELRRTRYGFAREARHRILVGQGAMTEGLRSRVARDPLLHVVGVRDLVGEAG